MSKSQTLSEAVSAIEHAATKKENVDEIDQKVGRAMTLLSTLNSELDSLDESIWELQFYRRVLDEGFDISPPGDKAISEARTAVEWDGDQVVWVLIDGGLRGDQTNSGSMSGGVEFDAYRKDIENAQKSVESSTGIAESKLRAKSDEWTSNLDSARELQNIIGTQERDFSQTVSWLNRLITQDIFEPSKSATNVVSELQNAKSRWEASEDLHGTDAFQQKHGLSDGAMSAITSLSKGSQQTLDDLSIEIIKELKSVPELAEAVTLQI